MPRTTDELVSEVVDVDATISLSPFIRAANALVTAVCASSGYSSDLLEQIETWLAAHLYTVRDNRVASEGFGRGAIQTSFQYRVDLYFENSMQGQQALLLDYKGNLAALQKKIKSGGTVPMNLIFAGEDDTPDIADSRHEVLEAEADTNDVESNDEA